jgi:hypothetical protein
MQAISTYDYRIWIAQRSEAISARMKSAVASTEASSDLADPMEQHPSWQPISSAVNYYSGHMMLIFHCAEIILYEGSVHREDLKKHLQLT